MGWVDIPPPPQGAGRLKVTLQLDASELQQTIALLKQAHQRLLQQGGTRGINVAQATTSVSALAPAARQPAPVAPAPALPVPQMQNLSLGALPTAPVQAQWAGQPAAVPPPVQPGMQQAAPLGFSPQLLSSGPVQQGGFFPTPAPGPMMGPGMPFGSRPPGPIIMAPPLAQPPPGGPRPTSFPLGQPPPQPLLQPSPVPGPAPQQQPTQRYPTQLPPPPPIPPAQQQQQRQPLPPPVVARQPIAPQPPAAAARVPAPSTNVPQAGRTAGGWQLCFTSDPGDHNSDPVQAMTYLPNLEGLPGGDGHAGWLISSSRGLMNLWECSPGGGPGHPSLMIMHSQMTDYLSSQLAVEADLGIMFAGSTDTRQNTDCVTVHSLLVESLLAFKYRFQPVLDNKDAAARRGGPGGGPAARQGVMNKVASLHQLGGHWRSCCASVHAGRVLIYEAPAKNQNTASLPGLLKPRQEWKAHDSPITALHCSVLGGLLFTGAADGGVLLWNLRERQPSAVRRLSLPAAVTAVQLVNEYLLAASSADGKVVLWDLRRAATPLQSVVPDGSPVVDIKTSPVADCLAVSTAKGLYTVDLIDYSGVVSPITSAPLPRPYLAIDWNERTGELYAAGHGGAIAVYRQQLR